MFQTQTFFPKVTEPGTPGRDVAEGAVEGGPGQARPDVQSELQETYLTPTPPPIIFGIKDILVPALAAGAAGQADLVLPTRELDWVAFFFPSAPAATLTFGPGAAILPVLAAALVVFPFIGTMTYRFNNSGGAAYTVYCIYGHGCNPPSITAI